MTLREQIDKAHCCAACWDRFEKSLPEDDQSLTIFMRRMILCPGCGNKRCPQASDHELACTGSNEPGQPGSVYPKIDQLQGDV